MPEPDKKPEEREQPKATDKEEPEFLPNGQKKDPPNPNKPKHVWV